jgi:hypothetical protein
MSDFFSSIPGIVYDFISRLIPGAIFVLLFLGDVAIPESTFGKTVLLVFMWAVGLTIDTITDRPIRVLLRFVPQKITTRIQLLKEIKLPETKYALFHLDPSWRNAISKGVADRTFFRTACAISFAVYIFKLLGISGKIFAHPIVDDWHVLVFLFFAVLFFICHWARGEELKKELKAAEEKIKVEKNKLGIPVE